MIRVAISLFLLGCVEATIECPQYHHGWSSKTCHQSTYCQYNYVKYVGGTGSSRELNEFHCGPISWPENEVTSNTSVGSGEIPADLKAIFPVQRSEFCPQGEITEGQGRWCRVTQGPESCATRYNCKLIECRCNVENCHAFFKEGGLEKLGGSNQFDLLDELTVYNLTTEGGCSGVVAVVTYNVVLACSSSYRH
eukprot:GFUD01010383.1.p1 GENE.GFUD01010383.1~~GFUD01010383.1.p1  ORF type:complete len:194 (+),score=34.56 GFUD01010383.1:152-733(+)